MLLLDERRGRRYAQTLGLPVVGTAGLLVQAKRVGLVGEVRPLLDALRDSGFRGDTAFTVPMFDEYLRRTMPWPFDD